MDPLFGVGIKRFLFEHNITANHNLIKTEILNQTKKYMPFLDIENIQIQQDLEAGNVMYLTIFYIIAPLNQKDTLSEEVRR